MRVLQEARLLLLAVRPSLTAKWGLLSSAKLQSSAYGNSPIFGTYNCISSGMITAHFDDRRHIVQFNRCTHGDHIIDGPLSVNFPGGGKPTEYDGSLTFHADQKTACHISLLANSRHSTGTFCGWDPEELNSSDY